VQLHRPTRPFHPRRAKNRWGKFFVSFLPAISAKAAKKIRQTIRDWRMASTRNKQRLEDLARAILPLEVYSGAPAFQRGPRSMGATEVQAVQTPRKRVDALAGAHRAEGPQVVCLVGTRREAGGRRVRAG